MRILILGGTGMIGHKLWHALPKRFQDVYTVIHREKSGFSAALYDNERVIESFDVSDFHLLDGLLRGIRPDVILNCIGITKRHPEANDSTSCLTLNSLLPHRLARWGLSHKARIFQFSTDCIFNGKTAHPYTEESLPSAEDLYGRTKYMGEIYGENCLTLRTSFIGRELVSRTELLEWLLAQNGKTIKGYRNALYTGVSTLFLARVVGDLIEFHPALSGLYHLSGAAISKYELLCLARDAFSLDIEIVPEDSFVCNRSLAGGRFRAETGIEAPPWPEMMREIAADAEIYGDAAGSNQEKKGSREVL